MIGRTLAHYEITAPLGKGGMGEVYRARDTKLGRDVAIKVLPTDMSGDAERLARFDREARTLAALQHPNIASIYGFETADKVRFLVMELVEGEDLSERLARGAIPLEEAVDLGLQLAEGLAAAHAVGVVHRDLKPANIKVTSEGKLKILDFGLARAYSDEQGSGSDSDLAKSPTVTAMTSAGVILGTAAYMSPEQARGKRADHRADIWAFGVVLFEMLSGRQLFEGETVSDTLAGVLRADVPWDKLPKNAPRQIRRLLERCLERDPSRRLQAAAEARIVLDDVKAGRADDAAASGSAGGRTRFARERVVWIVAVVVLLAAAAAMTMRHKGGTTATEPLVQSTLLPPKGWDFAPQSPFAVSPDGSQVAFVAFSRPENDAVPPGTNSLWVRDLSDPEPRQLTVTGSNAYPFWSADGRWLAFSANSKLNKIEARGGPVIPLCDGVNDGRGGTWNTDGVIVFQRAWNQPLMKIPAAGGTPEPVTTLNEDRLDVAHRWPQFLPDGRHFLYYVVCTAQRSGANENSGIYVGSLDSKESQLVLKSESRGLYARGHLLYRAGTTLMAQNFDPSTRQLSGDPEPVATDVPGGAISWGGAQFGVSQGILVHMRGAGATQTLLRWRDREGAVLKTLGEPSGYWEVSLSHDGTRIAVAIGLDAGDIWILDRETGTRTRFTFDPGDERAPIWSPGDSLLAFMSTRSSGAGIYVRPISGRRPARLVLPDSTRSTPTDWSSDGRLILYNTLHVETADDVWGLDTQTSKKIPIVSGKSSEGDGCLSPDDRWLAFDSDESGNSEIYVQSFPDAGGRWMVSTDGGPSPAYLPHWRSDGRELFYLRGSEMISVPVNGTGGSFSFGEPTTLFNMSLTTASYTYAVSNDGQEILTNELPPADQSKIGARLIQNWPAALAR